MVEQKPNIQTRTQEEINDPQGYADRKGGFLGDVRKKVSRRVIMPVAFAVGLSGTAIGCGDENKPPMNSITQPSTTEPELPTANITNQTTTTEKITTTTEAVTTTTEAAVGIDREFISTERSLADVTGKIEKGTYLTKPVGEIPADLQELFKSKNSGKKIVYVGKANQGDKMNAVVTDKVWQFQTFGDGIGQAWNFFGGIPESPWGEYPYLATMEFLDVVLIPDSEDFYMRGKNPLTESEMYIRISTDNSRTKDYPSVFAFDLAKVGQDPPGAKAGHLTWKWFLANHKLSDIIQPGDILDINFSAFGRGSLSDPDNIEWEVAVDERGVQYASRVLFTVFNEENRAAYEKLYR